MNPKHTHRLGEERLNNQGCLMKIVEYNSANDITVEFQDKYKTRVHTSYQAFSKGGVRNIPMRLGEIRKNSQGTEMKIVVYNNSNDMIVEFQDEYKARVHAGYKEFLKGNIRNPYDRTVFGVGMIGERYPVSAYGKGTKEYIAWNNMLKRCFDKKFKEKQPTYKDATCCNQWLLFENFYEWLHSQENFEKWYNSEGWHLDKDILFKENKVYSPETCCLVPRMVNELFTKRDNFRGNFPIGIDKKEGGFQVRCRNPITNEREYLGFYTTAEESFYIYKKRKEEIIKQVAEIEYNKGNITKQCYEAMMKYEVKITD